MPPGESFRTADDQHHPTRVRTEADPFATVWAPRRAVNFFPGEPQDAKGTPVRLVSKGAGQTFQPLLGVKGDFSTSAALPKLPSDIPFLPDQLVADDAVLDWTGRSLAIACLP